MNRGESRDNDTVERYLDRALAAYGDDEPRPGLDQRVMAHLRAAPERGVRWLWLPVPAVLALVAWAALSLSLSRSPKPAEVTTTARNEVQNPPAPVRQPQIQKTALANSTNPRPPRVRGHGLSAAELRKKLPKLPVFPSPQPLSEPERLLLALGQSHPEELRQIADWQEDFKKPAHPEASSPENDRD
jgi:hypothetical protein